MLWCELQKLPSQDKTIHTYSKTWPLEGSMLVYMMLYLFQTSWQPGASKATVQLVLSWPCKLIKLLLYQTLVKRSVSLSHLLTTWSIRSNSPTSLFLTIKLPPYHYWAWSSCMVAISSATCHQSDYRFAHANHFWHTRYQTTAILAIMHDLLQQISMFQCFHCAFGFPHACAKNAYMYSSKMHAGLLFSNTTGLGWSKSGHSTNKLLPSRYICAYSSVCTCVCTHRYSFFVAGLMQTWHWGFHSCNGLSADGDHDMWGGPYEVRKEKKRKEMTRLD